MILTIDTYHINDENHYFDKQVTINTKFISSIEPVHETKSEIGTVCCWIEVFMNNGRWYIVDKYTPGLGNGIHYII